MELLTTSRFVQFLADVATFPKKLPVEIPLATNNGSVFGMRHLSYERDVSLCYSSFRPNSNSKKISHGWRAAKSTHDTFQTVYLSITCVEWVANWQAGHKNFLSLGGYTRRIAFEGGQILVFLDNASCHSLVQLSNVAVIFDYPTALHS